MSFDKKAQNWDQNSVRIKRAGVFATEILEFFKDKEFRTALEFGSGTGLLSEGLKDKFESVTLVDTSEGMIDVLREKIREKELNSFHPVHIDMLKEDLPQDNFDLIYTLMTLHHIHDLDKIFQIFYAKLQKDGYLCIADLVKEDGSFHGSSDFDGHFGFDRDALKAVLQKNGFREVYYSQPVSIGKNIEEMVKEYPLFLLIAQKES